MPLEVHRSVQNDTQLKYNDIKENGTQVCTSRPPYERH